MTVQRITSFEGLRGFLAIWVMLGHITAACGYSRLPVLGDPQIAVTVFMILSGFVISHRIYFRREAYGPFLMRRFLRIYPAYLVSLIASAALAPVYLRVWSAIPFTTPDRAFELSIFQDSVTAFGPHLLTHLLLIQAFIPGRLLSNDFFALLSPAWSLSIEWIFYLIAPVILGAFIRPGGRQGGVTIALGLLMLMGLHFRVLSYAIYFLLGAASFFCWVQAPTNGAAPGPDQTARGITSRARFAILVACWASLDPGMMIWSVAFAAEAFRDELVTQPIRRLLETPIAQSVGRISYSIYVAHMLPLLGALWLCLGQAERLGRFGFLLAVGTLTAIGTAALAVLLYRFIELPFMRLGTPNLPIPSTIQKATE